MANYSKLQKDDLVNLAIARGIPNSEVWDLTKAQLVDFLNTHRDESGEWVTDPDPDDEPAAPAPEPAPAAAPAQPLSEQITAAMRGVWERHFELVDGGEPALGAGMVDRERAKFGNHPMFNQIGDEVRAEWNARHNLDTTEPQPVNNAPLKSRIDAGMGYTERYKSENWRSETPNNPGYDSLKTLADKQDEYIQALEARVKELETELADLRGDMERLAASELELVQQNTLLNNIIDRLGQRAADADTSMTEEDFGVEIARWARWNGLTISRVFVQALTDANFHDEATKIAEMFKQE